MKTYLIRVDFYGGTDFLYYREFPITAHSEQEARVFVSNTLSVMEFYNFKISEVKVLCG